MKNILKIICALGALVSFYTPVYASSQAQGPLESLFGTFGILLGPVLFAIVIAVIIAPFIWLAKLIRIIRSKATETPLMKAAAAGDVIEVKKLLSSGIPQDKADAYGRTALSWAIINNKEEVAKTLIDAGSAPTWTNSFVFALESKNERILLRLMEKVDAKMLAGNHLLKEAAKKSFSMDVLKKIIEKDADGAYKTPKDNKRSDMDEALSYAVIYNDDTGFVDFLLENGAGLADHPLYYAASKGSLPLVKKFIKLGDNIEAGYDNQTCLAVAAIKGHYEIAKLLLENKANPNVKIAERNNGITQYWSLLAKVKTSLYGESKKDMVSLLMQYGAK